LKERFIMSNKWKIPPSLSNLFWRNFILFLIILLVIVLSWWLGSIVGRYSLQNLIAKPSPPSSQKIDKPSDKENGADEDVPFYLYVGGDACSDIAQQEIKYATDIGVPNLIIDALFPWRGSDDLPELFRVLQCVNEIAPDAKYWVYLDLNPPEEWYQGKSSVNMVVNGEVQPFACFNSPIWKKSIEEGFALLVHGLQSSQVGKHIGGFILGFLKDRLWIAPGIDESEYAVKSFCTWVQNRYTTSEDRIAVFGVDTVEPTWVLENLHKSTETNSNFLSYNENTVTISYRRFFNESLADAIGFCAMTLRQILGELKVKICVPYGFNMETSEPASGQFALGNLVESDLDSFVLPVTYVNRGIGESGGPSGTINTLLLHGKEVLLLDDTRTGVSMDIATRKISRIKGVRSENIYAVQKRNLGIALVHNTGLIWTDPEGKGWLADAEQWNLFKNMMQIYVKQTTLAKDTKNKLALQQKAIKNISGTEVPPKEEPLPKLQVGKYNTDELQTELPIPTPFENILWEPLAVIIDERFVDILSPKGIEFYSNAVNYMRDQLLKLGLPIEFYLMQDLLDERIPKKLIYFIFSFSPSQEKEIETLHRIFESDKAIVIWYYVPYWTMSGQTLETVHNITQIGIKNCDAKTTAGSTMDLDGRWLNKDETFGNMDIVEPLVYIDDEDADIIARYQANGKPSIALKTVNEKWISVLYAEPALNYLVLREIFSILEIPIAIAEGSSETPDTLLVGTNTLIIHTKGIGDRILQFNQFLNIENLFQPEQKWFERETLLLSLGSGETIFLQLLPR